MKEAVLYTGTFDPFHLGHLWQLERTYSARPFEKAVIALISVNPKKPHAASWAQRKRLAELRLASKKLPFQVEIHPIEYVEPDKLEVFTMQHLQGYHVTRTVASDVILEFIHDVNFNFHKALLLFHYAIVVRPLVNQEKLERAIEALPRDIAKKFSYEIVHVQAEDDISATNIRKNPLKARQRDFITQGQLDFIDKNQLYRLQS